MINKKKASPAEESMLKSTEFCGRYLFGRNRSKKCHYPIAPVIETYVIFLAYLYLIIINLKILFLSTHY